MAYKYNYYLLQRLSTHNEARCCAFSWNFIVLSIRLNTYYFIVITWHTPDTTHRFCLLSLVIVTTIDKENQPDDQQNIAFNFSEWFSLNFMCAYSQPFFFLYL